jgi:hypothetical protein
MIIYKCGFCSTIKGLLVAKLQLRRAAARQRAATYQLEPSTVLPVASALTETDGEDDGIIVVDHSGFNASSARGGSTRCAMGCWTTR